MPVPRSPRPASGAIILSGWTKTLVFIVLSPLIGMAVGLGLMTAIFWVFRRVPPGRVDHWFRRLQLVSAAGFSLMHGANDAQKTMGIIAGALVTGGYLGVVNGQLPIPWWVEIAAYTAISLGTLTGGWRIIHTMGSKITKLSADGRLRRGDRGSSGDCHRHPLRRRREHDPHHHRRDRRRRRDAAAVGRSLGRRPADRVGLAPHHPCRRGVLARLTYWIIAAIVAR